MGVGACGVKHLGESEHVVCVACLRTLLACQHACEVFCRVEMLIDAVSADGDASVVDYRLPEILCGLVPVFVSFEVSDPLISDHLRDLGVRMHAGKMVFTFEQRFEDPLV